MKKRREIILIFEEDDYKDNQLSISLGKVTQGTKAGEFSQIGQWTLAALESGVEDLRGIVGQSMTDYFKSKGILKKVQKIKGIKNQ